MTIYSNIVEFLCDAQILVGTKSVVDPMKMFSSSLITIQKNLVAVSHTLCAYVGTKKSGDAGILSQGIWGVADPWKYACPLRVIVPNSVNKNGASYGQSYY